MTDNSTSSSDVEQPVTNGTLESFQSNQSNSNDLTTDTGTDDSTEEQVSSPSSSSTTEDDTDDSTEEYSDVGGGTSSSEGFSELAVADPTTGMTTNIFTGGTGDDTSGYDLSDDTTDDETDEDGAGTDEYEDDATVSGNDNFDNTNELDISVQGSPSPGQTVNSSTQLNTTDSGDDEVTGEDRSNASGSDTGEDTFEDEETSSVSGTSQSTDTNTVNTNDGQGNTANSTDTETDNGTIGGMESDDDEGSEDFADTDGAPTSDSEEDTDQDNALAQTSDKSTSTVTGTFGSVDPTTGLNSTATVTDNATDNENATVVDQDADAHTSSGVTDPATSDDESFDDKLTEGGQATDNETMSIVTQGTDTQGEQVNIQETVGLTASASATSSDEDAGADDVPTSGAATGGDTETVDATVQAHANIADTLTGTIIAVDPTTGIKTTTTDNISVTGTDDEHDQDDETDVRTQSGSAGSSENDTANQTNSSTLVINSSGTENVTQTNPDGSSAGAPTNTTSSSTDTISASVNLARSADGTTTTTPSGTETGSSTSSNPAVGSSTWSNQPLDQTSLDSFASNAAPLSDVSASGAGTSGNSGSGGGSGSTSGGTSGSTGGTAAPSPPGPDAAEEAMETEEADLCDGAKDKQATKVYPRNEIVEEIIALIKQNRPKSKLDTVVNTETETYLTLTRQGEKKPWFSFYINARGDIIYINFDTGVVTVDINGGPTYILTPRGSLESKAPEVELVPAGETNTGKPGDPVPDPKEPKKPEKSAGVAGRVKGKLPEALTAALASIQDALKSLRIPSISDALSKMFEKPEFVFEFVIKPSEDDKKAPERRYGGFLEIRRKN